MRKKEEEIQELEVRIREAKAYLQALQETLRMFPRAKMEKIGTESALRPGSSVAEARKAILGAGRPLHITELLQALGKQKSRAARAALAGSISAYVRKGEIFTRPHPNTFGLAELGHSSSDEMEPELPAAFGESEDHDGYSQLQ
jgi:hypothetical protein